MTLRRALRNPFFMRAYRNKNLLNRDNKGHSYRNHELELVTTKARTCDMNEGSNHKSHRVHCSASIETVREQAATRNASLDDSARPASAPTRAGDVAA
ncbi:hypothetical protein EVAR_50870_1 [Eumeta japonica]|uniref:Uncharacterized protein n=1 Tax=Eumeta variegata TaxID=151549 RepID=A0A4C1Y794_EUMVA|nr:hypothetical protein EVAR_50870_1 [Eumeta japonica]